MHKLTWRAPRAAAGDTFSRTVMLHSRKSPRYAEKRAAARGGAVRDGGGSGGGGGEEEGGGEPEAPAFVVEMGRTIHKELWVGDARGFIPQVPSDRLLTPKRRPRRLPAVRSAPTLGRHASSASQLLAESDERAARAAQEGGART